jgi:hypothetical protein
MTSVRDRVARTGLTVRAGKRRFVLAGVLLVAGGVPTVTGTVAHGAACQYAASLGHGWSVLATPPFTAGPTAVNRFIHYPYTMGNGALFSALPGNAQTLVSTNGTQIMRTTNGGCTWRAVYTFAQGDLGPDPSAAQGADAGSEGYEGAYEIQAFAAPRYAGTGHTMYAVAAVSGSVPALVASQFTVSPPVVMLKSTDDGASWQQLNSLPTAAAVAVPRCFTPADPFNGPLRVTMAPSNPEIVYLACGTNGYTVDGAMKVATGTGDLSLYESTDGGVSWVQRTTPTTEAYGVPLQGLAVDPRHPERAWLATNWSYVSGGSKAQTPSLWRSADSGQHWTKSATGRSVTEAADTKYPQPTSVALTGEFGVDMGPSGDVTLARGESGVLRANGGGPGWQTLARSPARGTVVAHSVFAASGDLYVVRDYGVPAGYAGPTYCTNTTCSWEQLFRVRGAKTTAIAPPGHLISDFYGLQSSGNTKVTTIYGYAMLKSVSTGASGATRNVFLCWTGDA